jgi:hypothetical protein
MGVPISFLDKYCPEQFEIIGQTQGDSGKELGLKPYPRELKKLNPSLLDGQLYYIDEDGRGYHCEYLDGYRITTWANNCCEHINKGE